MKTKLVVLGMIAVIIMLQLFNSCRHEILHDNCETNPIHINPTFTDAILNQSNGTISATATGGSGFKYSLNGGAFQDSAYFSGLQPFQSYNIVVKNSWGCTDTAIVAINSFNPCEGVIVVVSTTKINASPNQSNGSISANATGGSGFTYSLNGNVYQTSGTFNGLAAGNYNVTAKNSNGCTGTAQVTIGTNDPCTGVTVTVSTIQVNPTIGQSNGSVTASASGGSGFTYSLNNGAFQSSGIFTGLAEGNYTITAKNSNGCTGTKQITLTAVDPCAGVIVTVATTKVDPVTGQSNGSISASATGGSGFTYSLNGGAYQSSGTFTGLATGNYTITAKNSNGCVGSAQVALGSTNPCSGVTITVTTTQINPTTGQSDGSITASATGGSGFTYSLNGGAYQISGTFSGLAAGTYTVTAKNSNGCLGSTQATLTSTNPCAGVTVTVTTTQVNPTTGQSNGSITASATGGTGFTFSFNNGDYQSSGSFTGLAAGTYTITAKNSNGCIGSTQITLTATNPCTNTNIILSSVVVNYTPCVTPASGNITITATGSSGYTYNLNNSAYQASNIFSGLTAGNYTIGAKDLNGCTKTATTIVGTAASGPLFAQVRTLITTRCSGSGCHMNGQSQKGYNFDNDCSIVTWWSQINQTSVTYTMTKMPINPQPLLTAAEKKVITDWINAGHLYSK